MMLILLAKLMCILCVYDYIIICVRSIHNQEDCRKVRRDLNVKRLAKKNSLPLTHTMIQANYTYCVPCLRTFKTKFDFAIEAVSVTSKFRRVRR